MCEKRCYLGFFLFWSHSHIVWHFNMCPLIQCMRFRFLSVTLIAVLIILMHFFQCNAILINLANVSNQSKLKSHSFIQSIKLQSLYFYFLNVEMCKVYRGKVKYRNWQWDVTSAWVCGGESKMRKGMLGYVQLERACRAVGWGSGGLKVA